MKKYFILLLSILFLWACTQSESSPNTTNGKSSKGRGGKKGKVALLCQCDSKVSLIGRGDTEDLAKQSAQKKCEKIRSSLSDNCEKTDI